MPRTARLFRLLDALRARRQPVTAAQLAADLSVSVRTVYRDVQALVELGARIDADQTEALALGARYVQGLGDAQLAQAAETTPAA